MKVFAIYTDVNLIKKPQWLDVFREKYDKPYNFHITLKQPCFIDEEKITDLKLKVNTFFEEINVPNHQIELVFDKLITSMDVDGATLMLKVSNVELLTQIQKSLCSSLKEYSNYVKQKYQGYEENFEPHITIARNIPNLQQDKVMGHFKGDYVCEGIVSNIILAVVNEITPEEAKNPLNQTIYSL